MHTYNALIADLGNVIIAHWLADITPENFDFIDYNAIPEVPSAFESLRKLNIALNENVVVVYKASNIAQKKIFSWLETHRFSERTGIPLSRVVHSLNGRDKTGHLGASARNDVGSTIVVDDRLEVLSHFVGKAAPLFLFRPNKDEIAAFRHTGALDHVQQVETWDEILAALTIT